MTRLTGSRCVVLAVIWLVLIALPADAELSDESAAGFTSRSVHEIAASPAAVWDALTEGIARWWNPAHTWSGDAANLFLDGVAGEEFGEKLPGGGSVTHMDVIAATPQSLLRLRGGLGPLQGMAVVGVLTVELAAQGGGTRLTVTYTVGGYAADGLSDLAAPVDRVIVEQFSRLRAFLEP